MNLDRLPVRIEYIISLLMILWGLYNIKPAIEHLSTEVEIYGPYVSFLVGAVIIALVPNKTISKTVGLVAIVIGVSELFNGYLMNYSLGGISDIYFALALFYYGVGIALIVNGIIYLRGMTRKIDAMMYAGLFVIALEAFAVSLFVRMGMGDFWDTVNVYAPYFPYYLLLVLFIVMLKSDGISESTTSWRIGKSISNIRAGFLTNAEIGVTRDTMKRLDDCINSGKIRGPTVDFLLIAPWKDNLKLILSNNGGIVKAIITYSSDRTYVNVFQFKVTGFIMRGDIDTCDTVRLYGENGVFIQLIVIDNPRDGYKHLPIFGKLTLVKESAKDKVGSAD